MEVINENVVTNVTMDKLQPAVTLESVPSDSSGPSSLSATRTASMATPVMSPTESSAPALSSGLEPTPSLPRRGIRTVPASAYKAVALCLAEAFATDEMAKYFFECPDTAHWTEARKWALHLRIMEYLTLAHCHYGLVRGVPSASSNPESTGPTAHGGVSWEKGEKPAYDAVALWMPPGATYASWRTLVCRGAARLLRLHVQTRWQLSREGTVRLLEEFFPLLHATKQEVLAERDPSAWYLVYLGTRPEARGRGLAKRLISEVMKQVRSSSILLFSPHITVRQEVAAS